jgi:hypothetical protein
MPRYNLISREKGVAAEINVKRLACFSPKYEPDLLQQLDNEGKGADLKKHNNKDKGFKKTKLIPCHIQVRVNKWGTGTYLRRGSKKLNSR